MRPARDVLLLLLLAAALLLAGLGRTALTDRDEGANAGAAREMLEQGSWVTPTLDYVPRFAKPALVYWLMAAAYRALGVGEAAARFPSAVATTALVLVQYAFARWALGPALALRAALALLLSLEVVALGRMALTDATLALFATVAAYAFLRGLLGEAPRGRWFAAAYVALGLAALAKGPVGLVLPAIGVGALLVLSGEARRALGRARPVWGLALALAVAAPWYLAMFWLHGAEYAARARGETLGRVFRTVTGPGGTLLFYLPVLLLGFFPWSAVLPRALLGALRGARARARASRAGAVTVFAAAWVAAGVGFFSLVQSRLPHYVLPLFPPAALVVAASWPARAGRLERGLLAGTALAVAAGLTATYVAGARIARALAPAYPAAAPASVPASVLAVAATALGIAVAALAIRNGAALFRGLAVLAAILLAVGVHAVLPAFDAEFVAPAGRLAAEAARHAAPCDEVVAFGPYRPSLLFYARRPLAFVDVPDRSRLAEHAARPGRLFVLTPRAMTGDLPAAVAALPPLAASGGYVLLASAPAPDACQP